MKKIKKILAAVLTFLFIFSFVISCKTKDSELAGDTKAVLIKHPERMFWEIKKEDSSIYILGTIHFADKDFYPLEDKILEAFDKADVLVSEIGGVTEMAEVQEKFQTKMIQSINLKPEKDLSNFLSEDEISIIRQELGDTIAMSLLKFDPWILTMSLNQILYTKAGLDSQSGLDMHLMDRAGKRKIAALESIDEQLNLLSSGSFEEQVKALKKTIDDLQNADKIIDLLTKLKKLYLENNSDELKSFIGSLLDMSEGISEDALLKDRNIVWAEKFEEYLEKGGTTFVFAGLAHFLGEDSVFEQMRIKGILE
ncbi:MULTISPECIES: TraB/GumN family protein [unclassified Treponema]|uniref:TraB/GumN family protein n=1 Tax=unclassified Treponema TaxID=2638727 RepID=UPI0020A34B61|nr:MULTISPECIES: TraB/GumN family protein [unclassified Treponema]UTC66279.1 TraB/GumN family protein [Treponema sp. OMZ 789]UTC69009.1 TraB/GumN family protein [Treponema sp. OMZ 790]UTC71721.1 TraB/GumN family protein [Treponema sp. OMZ 791]